MGFLHAQLTKDERCYQLMRDIPSSITEFIHALVYQEVCPRNQHIFKCYLLHSRNIWGSIALY